jgi:hypothetical protein
MLQILLCRREICSQVLSDRRQSENVYVILTHWPRQKTALAEDYFSQRNEHIFGLKPKLFPFECTLIKVIRNPTRLLK